MGRVLIFVSGLVFHRIMWATIPGPDRVADALWAAPPRVVPLRFPSGAGTSGLLRPHARLPFTRPKSSVRDDDTRHIVDDTDARSVHVSVYSTLGCPHCTRAKRLLDGLGVAYDTVDVSEKAARDALALRAGGATSVPQIYVDERHIGGADDLERAVEDGSFAQALGVDAFTGVAVVQAEKSTGTAVPVEEEADVVDVRSLYVPGRALNELPDDDDGDNNNGVVKPEEEEEDIAVVLQRSALKLIDAHANDRGVDYAALRRSPKMVAFVRHASKLAQIREAGVDALSDAQCINIYNAMVMHATAVLGSPADSPDARAAFFSGATGAVYNIFGDRLSLDNLEHGVLRRSRDARGYANDSPEAKRARARDGPFDNRIHFALNCGAKSCPPVKLFRDASLDADLDAAARAFILGGEVNVSSSTSSATTSGAPTTTTVVVTLSRLFFWYAVDFLAADDAYDRPLEDNPDVAALVAGLSLDPDATAPESTRALLRAVADLVSGTPLAATLADLADDARPAPRLEFAPYDWARDDQ